MEVTLLDVTSSTSIFFLLPPLAPDILGKHRSRPSRRQAVGLHAHARLQPHVRCHAGFYRPDRASRRALNVLSLGTQRSIKLLNGIYDACGLHEGTGFVTAGDENRSSY